MKKQAFINADLAGRGRGGLIIDGPVIEAVGPDIAPGNLGDHIDVFDCKGRILLPGLVDMRVSTGEPGSEYRETLASASEAAAAGGVTTMVIMPNTDPVIDDAAIVDYVLRRARDTAIVRAVPMAAITKGFKGELISEIGLLREAGAVAITDATKAVANANIFRRALTYAKDFGMLVVQHVEEPTLATGVMHAGETASRLGLSGVSDMAEVIQLERDIRLVEMTRAPYHAAQISSAHSLEVIRRAKDKGLPVTCGVSVHHLTLNEMDIGAYRTFFKLSPPLRSEENRRQLVDAVADGTIDVVVSSHDPQSADTKRLPFGEAAFGAIGLDTMLSEMLEVYHSGNIKLERLSQVLSETPAKLLGLNGGRLAAGVPADFVLVDPSMSWKVEPNSIRSRSKNTPYEHRTLEGRAVQTFVAGRQVYAYSHD
jgi:dihydroorotase